MPFSQPYRFQSLPTRHRASSDFGDGQTPTMNNVSLAAKTWCPTTDGLYIQFPLLAGPKRDSPTSSESRVNAVRTEYNFNPRLYPGSARSGAAQTPSGGPNSQAVIRMPRGPINPSISPAVPIPAQVPAPHTINPSFDFSFRQHPPSLLSLPLPFSPPKRQSSAIQISSPQLTPPEDNQEQERTPESDDFRRHGPVVEERPQKGPFEDNISVLSAVSTPRFVSDAPLHDFGVRPGTGPSPHTEGSLPSPSDFSTDFSTISSASSSRVHIASPTSIDKKKRQPSVSHFSVSIQRAFRLIR